MHLGITISLRNLLIFFIFNGGLAILLIERIPREEKVLHFYFGKNGINIVKIQEGFFLKN